MQHIVTPWVVIVTSTVWESVPLNVPTPRGSELARSFDITDEAFKMECASLHLREMRRIPCSATLVCIFHTPPRKKR